MAWGKIDDKLYSSPKWIQVSKGGKALWVSALSWCMAQLTDGAVTKQTCFMLGASTKDARSLVEAGLWEETPNGYQFHDWLDYQPSREQVLNERKAAGERQRRAREKAKASRKRHAVTNAVTHGEVHPYVTGDVTVPPTRPDPTPTEPKGSVSGASAPRDPYPSEFEDFWNVYPKKADKRAALKAWVKATKRARPGDITDGAKRYRDDPNRDDAFTKHASTWLNADAWGNEPLPPRHSGGATSFDEQRHRHNNEVTLRAIQGGDPWSNDSPRRQLGQ